MKKRIVFISIFMLTGMIAGCSLKNSKHDVDNNYSSDLSDEYVSQEDSDTISEHQCNMGDNVNENASNEYVGQKDSDDVLEQHFMIADMISNENTTEIEIENSLNIVNIEKIEKEGGKVEFTDIMTYGDFQELGWIDDIDASLDDEEKVYVVKIYYPEGFEHYKVGKIENCEAIGVYRIEDGTYMGGCFREKE